MIQEINLTESNREALIIRWKKILILGLMDFFRGTNDFNKIIAKELLDMNEAIIKAFAESIEIPLHNSNRSFKGYIQILSEIQQSSLKDQIKEGLVNLTSRFSTNEQNSLREIRNNETHYLILNEIPKETILRTWRMLFELVDLLDPNLIDYSNQRHEFKDFIYLQEFFKKVILEGNRTEIDLNKIKLKVQFFPHKRVDRKNKTAEIEMEKCIWEIIYSIKKGNF